MSIRHPHAVSPVLNQAFVPTVRSGDLLGNFHIENLPLLEELAQERQVQLDYRATTLSTRRRDQYVAVYILTPGVDRLALLEAFRTRQAETQPKEQDGRG